MTGDMTQFKTLLGAIAEGHTLGVEEARQGFEVMMAGNATPSQMGAFLMALRVRGESVDEITGAAQALRARMTPINAPADAIDTVGTGGDAIGTYNISTATALVVAGAGVKVAKHGNRAFSSRSGAADVLTALGVNIDCPMNLIERAITEAGVGFMMAPRHHSAMRHVAGTRVELGTRTIFNLVGPISNPASVRRQLVGVFHQKWLEPIARTLGNLGSIRAWVVHGEDGLDEITTTGPTHVAELHNRQVRMFQISPEDAGLPRARLDDLKGGTPQHNAEAIQAILANQPGPYRDIVVLNAAAALVIADKAPDLRAGAVLAARSIETGAARSALERLIAISHLEDKSS
jgi:anthranilate phosphoribosyltransferase